MTEERFWELVGLLNWKKLGDDDAVVRPLVKALAKLPVEEIFAFDNHLAAKLHALDTEAHARHLLQWEPGEYLSVDYFLYTRCAVVANGREKFEAVLEDPTEFPPEVEFEAILSVAQEAYEQKTGEEEYPHEPTPSYETFSNSRGWPDGAGE